MPLRRSFFAATLFAVLALLHCGQGADSEPAGSLAIPVIQRDGAGIVTLECATPGAVIRYSLDGVDPGPKTGPYLAPIALPGGGVVKARAFTEDRKEKSESAEARFEPLPGSMPLPATLVPCTQDRDWPIYDWATRHAAVSRMMQEHPASLIFLGDSITQMFGGEPHDRPQAGQEIWETFYAQRNAANLGFGYDYVENTLWRLLHGELDGAQAKVVVIMIGTNNVTKDSPEEIAVGIEAICREVHRRQPAAKIVLMGIFPRGSVPDATRTKVAAINQLLAGVDGRDGVTFLDIGAKFLEADGSITRETMRDYLHPTAKGYEIWARELDPLLKKLLGEDAPPP